jgi:hypothetical protein
MITKTQVREGLKRLAEAIRDGAKLRPQGFGDLFTRDKPGTKLRSCVIGAAYEAAGGRPRYFLNELLLDTKMEELLGFDMYDSGIAISVPEHKVAGSVFSVVTMLNDHTKLTREEIATILEDRGRKLTITIDT